MAPSASKPDLLELASKVPEGSFLDKLLKADLEAKAGRPQSRSELLHGLSQSTLVQGGAVAFLLLGGISAWIFVFSFLLSGQALPMGRVSEGGSNPPSGAAPLGLPNLPKTLPDADKMAIKAVHFFAIYLVLLALADVLSGKLENRSGVLSIIVVLVTIACYPIALRSKGLGIGYSFTNLGIGRDAPWAKYIGIGLLSFFLEFPVSLLMASIGERVFPNQTFAHPAESVLAGSHNPLVFLALGLTACVQAPLFEETLFRGLLLPGLTKLIGSFGVSVCVTGLLFASLHPQGLGAWPGLFTIATAGCIATYYTRSLGPSIAMHAFHNGFTLLLAYFFS
jgi:membrane protease YdiL (CAAX protease family)